MEDLSHLPELQRLAFDKLTALAEIEQINHIFVQNPGVLQARLEAFMRYMTTLIGQIHYNVESAMPTRYIPITAEEPFVLIAKTYERKKGENFPSLDPRNGNDNAS